MARVTQLCLWLAAAACAAGGCEGTPVPARIVETDLLAGLPTEAAQLQALCARGVSNAVTAAFCTEETPTVRSIVDIQLLLDLDLSAAERPGIAFTAHSTALPARSVSAINPGSVIVSLPRSDRPLNGNPGRRRTDGNVVTMAYARGDSVVELAVNAPNEEPVFYLLRHTHACGDACGPADLLTARAESDWTGWSLYDDSDLKNTVFDCLHCHQPDGPGTRRIYRMQEPENPWTHWLAAFTLGGRVLLDDTVAAHGTAESIAGIPGALLVDADPIVVEDLIRFTDSPQPNVFPSPMVEAEVQQSNPAQPRDNAIPGTSAAWDAIYARAVAGEAIPPPYHDVKVTDPDKLKAATRAVQSFRAGVLSTLPDIREVFSDDALVGMSVHPKRDLDGEALLVHACAQCHNSRLDPTLSRARFDATRLHEMDAIARAIAIERLVLPEEDREHMPPRLFRTLSPEEVKRAIDALR